MSGSLVVSLDFELMWGVRDHRSVADYGDAVLGGRTAIPAMLARFADHGIRATWATVGLLFARNRDEMRAYAPIRQPAYTDARLSPYPALAGEEIGPDEVRDPLHFGRSLIDRIADTPGQEIASHTYSHYYCLEPGQDMAAFAADLAAANAIAADAGHRLQSIVFPRNQKTPDHAATAAAAGIGVYRGEAEGWLYRPRAGAEVTLPFRALRFADGALPLGPAQIHAGARREGTAVNVPASRFLRPWSPKFAAYDRLHLARIAGEMRQAAKAGAVYHLWWHPHNFGRHTDRQLARLDRLLTVFRDCRERWGMTSAAMADLAA